MLPTPAAEKQYDVLLLGATGFTGRLATRYLATHQQRAQFTVAFAGRSQAKLEALARDLQLPSTARLVQVDVTDSAQVESVVKVARVVINTVGPFRKWGTPVVRACVRHGVHYVDITGEANWVLSIIAEFDYAAGKTGSVIVPSCGVDSIPSDLTAFIGNATVKALPRGEEYRIFSSVTAHEVKGGISGGTISTITDILESVPPSELRRSRKPYALSPAIGLERAPRRLLYEMIFPGIKPIVGALFFMKDANLPVVERTWGLLEWQAISAGRDNLAANKARYGKYFVYDEFMITPNKLNAVLFTLAITIGGLLFVFVKPFRWLAKKFLPAPGEGPAEDSLEDGYLYSTNKTEAYKPPGTGTSEPLVVKTVLKLRGDPGYLVTSVLLTEAALCMVLPSTDVSPPPAPTAKFAPHAQARARLPPLAQKGGVLTPMTAFGSVLVERLLATGRVQLESEVVSGKPAVRTAGVENRKDI